MLIFYSVFRTLGAEDQNNIKLPGRQIKNVLLKALELFRSTIKMLLSTVEL